MLPARFRKQISTLFEKNLTAPFVLKPYTNEKSPTVQWVRISALLIGLGLFCLIYGFYYALTTPYLLTQFMIPVAILAGLTIWALPDMKRAPTRSLEVLFFAFFIMVVIWPNYLAVALPGLPWITSLRLFGFPLAFCLLVSTSISEDFRSRTWKSLRAIPLLSTFVIGFFTIQVLSVGLSNSPFYSLNTVISMQISWTAIFFTSCYVFLRPGNVEKWAVLLWICVVFVSLMGIWEQRLGRLPWAGHIPSFLAVGDEFVQRIFAGGRRLGSGKYRVQATQSTSLGLAELLALSTPFILHFMIGPFKNVTRLAAAATFLLLFYVIMATDARLGMVGFFMSCLLYLLAWSFLRWRRQRGSLIGPALVFAYPVIFCGFMAATFFVQRLKIMVWGGGAAAYSNQGRMDQVSSGLPKILERPIGYGAGKAGSALGYTNLSGVLTIDNYYLAVALEYGIVGFVFYYGAILITIYAAGKYTIANEEKNREYSFLIPLAISLSVFFVIKSIFSQLHNHPIQFMMMGMVAALVFRMQHGDAAGLPPTKAWRRRLGSSPQTEGQPHPGG